MDYHVNYATFRFRFIKPSMARWISDFYNYYYAINPPPGDLPRFRPSETKQFPLDCSEHLDNARSASKKESATLNVVIVIG